MKTFSRYQVLLIAMLAFLQFTTVLDFMILSPLGVILMPKLGIDAHQFGVVVSAYAFSAFLSGILAASFADRFDRKRLLLMFYAVFLLGTFLCGIAPNYPFLLGARIVTGFSGGIMSSLNAAIVADLFPMQIRGRVLGTIQSAFSASQILGVPIGLTLASIWGWHGPFLMIVGVGLLVGVVIMVGMKPVNAHLTLGRERRPLQQMTRVLTTPRNLIGFSATMLVATGGFMMQPFASAFLVHNLGVPLEKLPMVYLIPGLCGLVGGPLLGRLSDSIGKFKVFLMTSVLGGVWVLWYTELGAVSMAVAVAANAFFAVTLTGRIATNMAILSAVPPPNDRGTFMAMAASAQQLAGGVASWLAGLLVIQGTTGAIENYWLLGFVVAGATVLTLVQMYRLNRLIAGDGVSVTM